MSQDDHEAGESRTEMADDRTEFAATRTDYAEDRTLMANERTFAGWMRTGLAAVGIGLGFNALFGKLRPEWLPRGIATAFILIGIFIFYAAQRSGYRVTARLEAHQAEPIQGMNMRIIAGLMASASTLLVVAIWMMQSGEGQ